MPLEGHDFVEIGGDYLNMRGRNDRMILSIFAKLRKLVFLEGGYL